MDTPPRERDPSGERRRLRHPVAFLLALLTPPLLMGAIGFALFSIANDLQTLGMIGIFIGLSPIVGGPSYLLVGAPLFWRAAKRGEREPAAFAVTGLLADVIAAPIAAAVLALLIWSDPFRINGDPGGGALAALAIHAIGLVFAPIYGAVFGLTYRRLAPPPVHEADLSAEATLAVFR